MVNERLDRCKVAFKTSEMQRSEFVPVRSLVQPRLNGLSWLLLGVPRIVNQGMNRIGLHCQDREMDEVLSFVILKAYDPEVEGDNVLHQ